MPTKFTESQFWSCVEKTDSCWLWLGRRDDNGYGRVAPTLAGTAFAHRAAYTLVASSAGNLRREGRPSPT